jgi:hypothetical protein
MAALKQVSFRKVTRSVLFLLVAIVFLTSTAVAQAQEQTPPSHPRFTTGLTPFSMEEKAVDANDKLTNPVTDPSFESAHPNPHWIENDNMFGTPLCIGQSDCGYWTNARPRSGSGWAWFGGAAVPYHTASLAQTVTFPACGVATLQFYLWIGYSFGGGADDQFFARVDGVTVFSANATQTGTYPSYKPVSVNVGRFANGAPHTIEFSHVNQYNDVGFHLDDISLVFNSSCLSISGNADGSGVGLVYTIGSNNWEANTDSNGNYLLRVPMNWTGTVLPTGFGEPTFVPGSRTYSNLTTNRTGQNYKMYFGISGNTGVGSVTLSYTDGTPKTVTSQANGAYSLLLPRGWSGTVTPSRSGYRFSPVNRSYSPLFNSGYNQDYTAIPLYTISGNAGVAGVTLTYTDESVKTVTSQANGNYSLSVPTGWSGTVTPTHACFTFTPANRTYPSLAGDQTSQNYAPSFNAGAGCADIDVLIGGANQGRFGLPSAGSTRASFPGLNNGPVQIESTNAVPLIAAERLIYKFAGVPTSFTEMMGLPDGQLDTTYWLPWYNNVDLDTQLRIGNVSGASATVHIWIGTTEVTPIEGITLPAGGSTRLSYAGVNNGPVKIVSTENIVAAERLIYKVGGANTSFSEMMALPNSQLDTTYWLPWYNNVDLDTQLRFANVHATETAEVHVYIGGVEMPNSPFTLLPGESTRQSFAGVNNGPVKIVSNVPIVAAERLIYRVGGVNTSFTEMMALPNSQLNTTYWLPWYNNIDLDTQLRFANVHATETAQVHVYIGGVEMLNSPFTLLPGASTRQSFAGINNGPVRIVSNVPIVAAERLIYKVAGVNTSFSEMMALPASALDTIYWLPWYNNLDLDTQLRFGVP